MALSIGQLDAITERYIMPKLFDNLFDSNPLLKRLLASGQYHSVPGGTYVDIPLAYAGTTAHGWFKGTETLSTAENDMITSARYDWCNVYAGITISEEDELKNGGDKGVLKLLASKAQQAEKTIKDDLGTGLYSDGTTTSSIVGLRDIVATDQTVGGISQTNYTWWAGQVDSSTTTTTIGAVNLQYENASIDNEKPTAMFSTRSLYTKYYNLLQPQQRFTDGETAKGGFVSLMFNGVPWISDSHVPTAHLFGINEKHLWLCYHPEANFVKEPFARPINQRAKVSRIVWMGALGSSNNRLHFKFSGLTA